MSARASNRGGGHGGNRCSCPWDAWAARGTRRNSGLEFRELVLREFRGGRQDTLDPQNDLGRRGDALQQPRDGSSPLCLRRTLRRRGGGLRKAPRRRRDGVLLRAGARGDELPQLVLLRLRPAALHQARLHRRHDLHDPREPREGREGRKMGKVRVSYSVYKGEGELALYCEHLMTALYRDPSKFEAEADAAMEARKGA